MSGDDPKSAPGGQAKKDVLFVYGKTEGDALSVLRQRGETLEVGAIRQLEEGKPVHGEIVRLQRRDEHPLLFDVNVLADTRPQRAGGSGPAQVASDAYRENWEAVFGGAKKDGGLN